MARHNKYWPWPHRDCELRKLYATTDERTGRRLTWGLIGELMRLSKYAVKDRATQIGLDNPQTLLQEYPRSSGGRGELRPGTSTLPPLRSLMGDKDV